MNIQDQVNDNGVHNVEFVVKSGYDVAYIYADSRYVLSLTASDDTVLPGSTPEPAAAAGDSSYRKHSLSVFQVAKSTRRCKVVLYLKANTAKEEIIGFRGIYKAIVEAIDKAYIEIQTDDTVVSEDYIFIGDRFYTCEIMTMDNKTHSGIETRPTIMVRTTLEEAKCDIKLDDGKKTKSDCTNISRSFVGQSCLKDKLFVEPTNISTDNNFKVVQYNKIQSETKLFGAVETIVVGDDTQLSLRTPLMRNFHRLARSNVK